MKRKLILVSVLILVLCVALLFWKCNRTIGKLSGAENEYVILDNGTRYEMCDDAHTIKDKGWIMGTVTGAYNTTYYVYSVCGESTDEYIYVAALGRGMFYRAINIE